MKNNILSKYNINIENNIKLFKETNKQDVQVEKIKSETKKAFMNKFAICITLCFIAFLGFDLIKFYFTTKLIIFPGT